jgi:hypothetical protein
MLLQNVHQGSDFRDAVEKPALDACLASILACTGLGVLVTYLWLVESIPVASLSGAVMAGAAVGASAGILLFGLVDVVISGRLEESAEIVEDADAVLDNEEKYETPPEFLGQEEDDFTLQKAS